MLSDFVEFLGRADLALGLVDFLVVARFEAVDCRVAWAASAERGDRRFAVRFFADAIAEDVGSGGA